MTWIVLGCFVLIGGVIGVGLGVAIGHLFRSERELTRE